MALFFKTPGRLRPHPGHSPGRDISKGFEIAGIAKFNKTELDEYEKSLMTYRDLKAIIDTSFEEGEKIGIDKGKRETAKIMKREGEAIEKISRYTGLSKEEIEAL